MSNSFEPDSNWERVAAELQASRDSQQTAWGSIDNATLGRYLADEVTGEERRRIEQEMQHSPELRMLTDLVRDVLTEFEPVLAPAPVPVPHATSVHQGVPRPATLSFAEHAAQRAAFKPVKRNSPFGKTFRQRTALVAAACLLMGVALSLRGVFVPTDPRLPIGDGYASRDLTPTSGFKVIALSAKPNDLGASSVQLAQLDKVDRQVAELQTKGQGPAAMALAGKLPDVAKEARLEEHPRYADSLNRAGMVYQANGDLAQAQENYKRAYGICQKSLKEEHPATVQSLANVYQADINRTLVSSRAPLPRWEGHPMTTMAPAPGSNTILENFVKKEDKSLNGAAHLPGRPILRQHPSEVKQHVVPVLVRALKEADTLPERLAYIQALARLGPAARGAVPELTERLSKPTTEASERQAILAALGEMGPSANKALDVLVESLKSADPSVSQAARASLVRYGPEELAALSSLPGSTDAKGKDQAPIAARRAWAYREACGSITDGCDLFSVQAVVESQRDMLTLVRNNGPVLYITTMDRDGKKVTESEQDVRKLMDVEGVTVVLSREGQAEIRVPDALQQRGFTLNKQSELQTVLEKHLKERDYDGALREAILFINKLNFTAIKK
jgi:tetratricopeptide (TPR) repeat protein